MELEKMKLASASGSELNLEALYQIMPSAFTEVRDEKTGKITHKINFSTLRELLGDNAYDEADEEYGFKWVGKNAARREAARSINKTLRPCPEESVDWENTQNLYIEGDNLEVLKLLQKSYLGKIKMIYIDPPYNTGNDFVYRDDFAMDKDGYDRAAGDVDELGTRFRRNTDGNGRFHSDWCSMIYERLLVSRALLSNDGVIFISIDDNEVNNLLKICNEVFGEQNFVSQICLVNNIAGRSDSKHIAKAHEYIIVYQKSDDFISSGMPLSDEQVSEYKFEDDRGKYRLQGLRKRGSGAKREDRPNMFYPIYYNADTGEITTIEKDGYISIIPKLSDNSEGRWRWGKDTFEQNVDRIEVRIVSGRGEYDVYERVYLNGDDGIKTTKMKSFLLDSTYTSDNATSNFRGIMEPKVFDSPKSVSLMKDLTVFANSSDSVILDFFSGSATTAHAVMQLNAEDGGNRRYIMVQLPEETEAGSEAYKAGYKNICEIGKERIRRAGRKIKEEAGEKAATLDTGFRVFKCEDSFMNDVYFSPAELQQQDLFAQVSNIKDGTSDLSMLFGCMLDWGVQLSLPLSTFEVAGKTIYNVNDGDLVACFNENVNEDAISAIAELNPLRVVFRDSCFGDAPLKMNLFELFKQKCGWSEEVVRSRVHVI